MDSLIDLRADRRAGVSRVAGSLQNHLRLARELLRSGLPLIATHPQLAGLFWEAVRDDFRDRFRAAAAPDRPL